MSHAESERVPAPKPKLGRPPIRDTATVALNTKVDARTKRALEEEAVARGTSVARLLDALVMLALPERFDRDD